MVHNRLWPVAIWLRKTPSGRRTRTCMGRRYKYRRRLVPIHCMGYDHARMRLDKIDEYRPVLVRFFNSPDVLQILKIVRRHLKNVF